MHIFACLLVFITQQLIVVNKSKFKSWIRLIFINISSMSKKIEFIFINKSSSRHFEYSNSNSTRTKSKVKLFQTKFEHHIICFELIFSCEFLIHTDLNLTFVWVCSDGIQYYFKSKREMQLGLLLEFVAYMGQVFSHKKCERSFALGFLTITNVSPFKLFTKIVH